MLHNTPLNRMPGLAGKGSEDPGREFTSSFES